MGANLCQPSVLKEEDTFDAMGESQIHVLGRNQPRHSSLKQPPKAEDTSAKLQGRRGSVQFKADAEIIPAGDESDRQATEAVKNRLSGRKGTGFVKHEDLDLPDEDEDEEDEDEEGEEERGGEGPERGSPADKDETGLQMGCRLSEASIDSSREKQLSARK